MGIKYLNRFLLNECRNSKSICKQNLEILSNKTIVIDTSIYMYKYTAQDALIEQFYLMISIFREYNITPFFVFDGKPPPEKWELLKQRQTLKDAAEKKYAEIQLEIVKSENKQECMDMTIELESLKKQFVRLRFNDIQQIKKLFQSYGVSYYDAQGEADRVCASLVISGKAWACLSDDMDMFVYGCPRVLRHLSLYHNTVLIYDTNMILKELQISLDAFRQIAVLSGTDYNTTQSISIYDSMNCYKLFSAKNENKNKNTFYEWLHKNTTYISNYESLIAAYNMFCISDSEIPIKEIDSISNKAFDIDQLKQFMSNDGFIFI